MLLPEGNLRYLDKAGDFLFVTNTSIRISLEARPSNEMLEPTIPSSIPPNTS
jgi:hypothetical protein